jgi:hypothetical protein
MTPFFNWLCKKQPKPIDQWNEYVFVVLKTDVEERQKLFDGREFFSVCENGTILQHDRLYLDVTRGSIFENLL